MHPQRNARNACPEPSEHIGPSQAGTNCHQTTTTTTTPAHPPAEFTMAKAPARTPPLLVSKSDRETRHCHSRHALPPCLHTPPVLHLDLAASGCVDSTMQGDEKALSMPNGLRRTMPSGVAEGEKGRGWRVPVTARVPSLSHAGTAHGGWGGVFQPIIYSRSEYTCSSKISTFPSEKILGLFDHSIIILYK